MFSRLERDRVHLLLSWFNQGKTDRILTNLRLSETKFVDKEAVLAILHEHLEAFYRENWGDPNDPRDVGDEF
jgi:hypothetical protein